MDHTEQFLAKCGDFGKYQFLLIGLFCIINILSAMHYYSQTIISFTPDHWCYADNLLNLTYEEIRAIYSTYPDPYCSVLNETFNSKFCIIRNDDSHIRVEICEKWIYNLDYNYQSMTTEFNWVCQNAWKSTIGQSMFFVGSVIGTMCLGYLADKYGRLPMLLLANFIAGLGNTVTIFTFDAITFAVSRFISGLATDSNHTLMYILVLEYIRPSKRTIGLNLSIGIFYCFGSIITPWIAVALGNWKFFLAVTSLPTVFVMCFYFVVPESALWLISRNRTDDAIRCFHRVAKFNGKTLTDNDIREFKRKCSISNSKLENKVSILGLFKTPRLRKNTCILLFKSMVITLCYDATSRNVEGLGITPFAMFSLSAAAILPACLVLLLLQDKIGRKAMASSSLLICGIFTLTTGIIIAYQHGVNDPILLTILAIIGRFGVTVAYNSGAQYATELIPTCVRGQGVAAVHVAGYALTFFSAYILYLGNIFKPMPSLILGGLSLIGAILVLLLPETLNRVIPTTLHDGEMFGKGEKIFYFPCLEKKPLVTEATSLL